MCQCILRFLHHIAPALISVVVGAWIVQRFFVSKSNEAALIDWLIRELETLQDLALEYWSSDSQAKRQADEPALLAQKVKGRIRCISGNIRYYCDRYGGGNDSMFSQRLMDVSDACTGGQFESVRATQSDPSRYLLIVNAITQLRSDLWQRKL